MIDGLARSATMRGVRGPFWIEDHSVQSGLDEQIPNHSTVASNIDTSIVVPSSVRARRSSAASTDCEGHMPAAISEVGCRF